MRCYLSLSQIGPFFADMQSSPTFPKTGPFWCTPSTKLLPRRQLLSLTEDGAILDTRGQIYLALGRFDEAFATIAISCPR